jgi:hypothetical protein
MFSFMRPNARKKTDVIGLKQFIKVRSIVNQPTANSFKKHQANAITGVK